MLLKSTENRRICGGLFLWYKVILLYSRTSQCEIRSQYAALPGMPCIAHTKNAVHCGALLENSLDSYVQMQ